MTSGLRSPADAPVGATVGALESFATFDSNGDAGAWVGAGLDEVAVGGVWTAGDASWVPVQAERSPSSGTQPEVCLTALNR
jgi:hypothetical protein